MVDVLQPMGQPRDLSRPQYLLSTLLYLPDADAGLRGEDQARPVSNNLNCAFLCGLPV